MYQEFEYKLQKWTLITFARKLPSKKIDKKVGHNKQISWELPITFPKKF